MPVDFVVDIDFAVFEADGLDEFGLLPGVGNADGGLVALADELDGVSLGEGDGGDVEGAGVDVPGIVVLGVIREGLELVAAGVGGEVLKFVGGVVDAGDAAGGGGDADGEAVGGVLEDEVLAAEFLFGDEALVGAGGAVNVDGAEDLVAECGDGGGIEGDFRHVGFRVAGEDGGLKGRGGDGGVYDAQGLFRVGEADAGVNLARALPAEGVVDDDGLAFALSTDGGVDVVGDEAEGAGADFVGGPADDVVVLLRVLVDDADAGAGSEVVELVEEDLLPVFGDFRGGIGLAVEPGKRGPCLGVEDLLLGLAHVLFVVGLGGHDAAVVLEVELGVPGGDGGFAFDGGGRGVAPGDGGVVPDRAFRGDLLFDRGEEGLGYAELHFGQGVGFGIGDPGVALVEDGAGGTATVVADAVEVHDVGFAGGAGAGGGEIGGEAGGIKVVVGVVVGEVGEDLGAVGGLPPEELEGQLVGIVPGHLLGDEVVDAGLFVDLGELPVVAEGVGVPADADIDAVGLLVEALADQELADEGFAVGHVEVGLDPHAAYDFPAAFLDAAGDVGVEVGVFFGHPLVVEGGGLGVGVLGVLVHELEGGAEGALDGVNGLSPGPEPGGIDVGVASEMEGAALKEGAERAELLAGGGEGGVEGGLVGGIEGLEVHGLDGIGEGLHGRGVAGGEGGDEEGGGLEFLAEIFRVGAGGGEVDAHGCALEVFGVDGVEELDGDGDGVAGLGVVEEDDGFEVVTHGGAAAVEVEDLGHRAVGVGVELEPDAGAGEVVAVEGLGNGDALAEPDGVIGRPGAAGHDAPVGVVESDGFAVGEVAGVHLPGAGGQLSESGEARQDLLGGGGQCGVGVGNFSVALGCGRCGGGEEERAGKGGKGEAEAKF